MSRSIKTLSIFMLLLAFVINGETDGQSGGGYTIEESVISNGGGPISGGGFVITSTKGQPIAGDVLFGGGFSITSGFWNFVPSSPTAAPASLAGRALTSGDGPISGAIVVLTSATGESRSVRTNTFGRFRFDLVSPGETYIISISARRYTFSQPTRVIFVTDNIDDLDFTANP